MGAELAAEGREFPAQGVVTQRALDEAGLLYRAGGRRPEEDPL